MNGYERILLAFAIAFAFVAMAVSLPVKKLTRLPADPAETVLPGASKAIHCP